MKKYRVLAIFLFIAMVFTSCEEYLDKNPESDLSEDQIYQDYDLYKGTVDRITGLLHNYGYSQFDYGGEVGTYSDECQQAKPGVAILTHVNTGNWLNSGAPGFSWKFEVGQGGDSGHEEFHYRKWTREVPGEATTGIRACNLAIKYIDQLEKFPEESIYSPEELKAQLLGQAYLMRGWFYFMLIRDYGGMPNMQEVFPTEYNFDQPRPEYWESSRWAVEDLSKAIELLPERWILPTDLGRVTKTTAKAVKSMILLYQASPNMGIPRDESLSFAGEASYVDSILPLALDASVEALAGVLSGETRYRLYSETEYSDNFYVNSRTVGDKIYSDEAIFQPPHSAILFDKSWGSGASDMESGTGLYLPWFEGSYDWAMYSVPTQNAVDFFETSDGWEVGDWHLGQGDAVEKSSVWDRNDPYSNRDPRLKKFVFCHNDKMYLMDEPTRTQKKLGGLYMDAREGEGHNSTDAGKPRNHSGFYHAGKFRWPGNNKFDKNFHTNSYVYIFPFIRVAQVYLDMAEVANELYGPTGGIDTKGNAIDVGSALDCINVIRNRVGMPDVHPEYYASKETFREYIRMERARELYFEQHRWQDLKRWRTADKVLSKGIWVADISGDAIDNVTYSKKKSENFVRVFENKHYWYPFQESDMNLFDEFQQNPGW